MQKNSHVRTCDSIVEDLNYLHTKSRLTYREIAVFPEYSPIPPGTLCAIAKGAAVPKKWLARLGLPAMLPAPACAKCGKVHTTARCTDGKQPRRRWVRGENDGHAGGHWE